MAGVVKGQSFGSSTIITKTQPMQALDARIQKIFLNFTVGLKKFENYELCEPFASLERLEDSEVLNGAR